MNAHDRVYQVDFTKEKLAAMQAEERRLPLLLGHAANEINVLFLRSLVDSLGPRFRPGRAPRGRVFFCVCRARSLHQHAHCLI